MSDRSIDPVHVEIFTYPAALRVARLERRVEVAESVTAVDGLLTCGAPNGHTRRWVSVPRFVAEQLGAHVVGKPGSALVFESSRGGVLRVIGRSSAEHA